MGWALVATVCYLSLTPKPPKIDIGIDFFDKISHFIAYASMMGWFVQIYQGTKTRIYYALGFIGMGVGIEILQGMGQARMFEYADMLANSFGVVMILLIMQTRFSQLLWHIEQKANK